MKFTLKTPDKDGNNTIIIKKPIATPFQILEDKIRIKLVYVPKQSYYWLIEDIIHKRKTSTHINITLDPETLDESENVKDSSIYQLLRMYIINSLNELDIENFKYNNELNPKESITEDIFYKHIGNIAEILHGYNENNIDDLKHEVGEFKDIYETGIEFIKNQERGEILQELKNNYSKRKNIGKSNLDLSFILTDYLKIEKQNNSHLLYRLYPDSKGYTAIELDSIHKEINELIGKNLVNTKDLETSLSHIPAKLKPEYDKIKFKNGVYDLKIFKFIEPDKPIFTMVDIDYNYNKKPYPTISEFLNSSLWQGNEKKTKQYVLGVKEIIGYLFLSGNQDEIMIFIVGVPGSGKSTTINLITSIFGKNKVSDMKPQDTERNIHVTAGLLGKLLNIMRDTDSKPVENIGLLKQMRGYDDLDVYPKGRDTIQIPKEEVPKNLLTSNKMPIFKNIDEAFQ